MSKARVYCNTERERGKLRAQGGLWINSSRAGRDTNVAVSMESN